MDKRPTNEEWADQLRPYLAQFQKRSARRKLCRMHKDGPVKESKVQCPWKTGENAFAAINTNELKILLIIPSGGTVLYEYNADGNLANIEGDGMDKYLQERGGTVAMEQTQAERDRLEFIELLQFLNENDPDGFSALCAKAKTILTGEVKADG